MKTYDKIHLSALLKTLFIKVFSNKFCMATLDLLMTIVISIHTASVSQSSVWIIKLIIYFVISITINGICILADYLKKIDEKTYQYFDDAYNIQYKINQETSSKLYRINKRIIKAIREKRIEKGELNAIADFQTFSFMVCTELCDFIMDNFDCGDCEATIFQRFTNSNGKDFVKMIAFKNNKKHKPSSYGKEFSLNSRADNAVFVSIFNDLNEEIKILPNKKAVQDEFKYFDDSKKREKKICQYIGIPIKTNRNKIEILLQIDVSKEKALGKNYNELKQFSEFILLPFCSLLHCSYERDLIFNKFYDILEENISKYYF